MPPEWQLCKAEEAKRKFEPPHFNEPFAFTVVHSRASSHPEHALHPKFLISPRIEEGIARLVASAKTYLASRGVDLDGLSDQAILEMQRQHKFHQRGEIGRKAREAKRPPHD